jgi:hypothetical protein
VWGRGLNDFLKLMFFIRHEICLLLGYYTAHSGGSLPDVSEQPIGPIFKGQEILGFTDP